uniref:Uncharacterized protein n=1 Tax=Oryza glumipatula TaxID=40148 RepID=A0A0D9YKC9_9ORYZ
MVLHFHGIGVNSVYVFALDLGTFASHGIQPSLSITLAGLPSQSYATGSIGIIEKGAPASRQWRSMADEQASETPLACVPARVGGVINFLGSAFARFLLAATTTSCNATRHCILFDNALHCDIFFLYINFQHVDRRRHQRRMD